MATLSRCRWKVVYLCDGVPYGRYYERWRWIAEVKAWWLRRDPYYANVRVVSH